ncbi:MAG TPA: hypothetical protein VMU30_02335 [Bacteroidota bacterium]|nr:hypothetical protein [Bacteroidota bacterium]
MAQLQNTWLQLSRHGNNYKKRIAFEKNIEAFTKNGSQLRKTCVQTRKTENFYEKFSWKRQNGGIKENTADDI